MNNFDKRVEAIFKDNIDVPDSFENAIKSALEKKGVVNMKKKFISKKVLVVLMTCVLLVIGGVGAYPIAKDYIEFKQYENRPIAYSRTSIDEAIANGYIENLDMEYNFKEGVGVKIEELSVSSDTITMINKIKFERLPLDFDPAIFSYDLYITDENKNVYTCGSNAIRFYKEQGIEYDKTGATSIKQADRSNILTVNFEDNIATSKVELNSTKGFSKGQKLTIRIANLYFFKIDYENPGMEKVQISDVEYVFEIDLPERFYDRNEMEYKVATEVDGFKLVRGVVTETGFTFVADIDGMYEMIVDKNWEEITEYCHITNERGEKFGIESGWGGYPGRFKTTYSMTMNDATEKLYVHTMINGEEKIIELIRK